VIEVIKEFLLEDIKAIELENDWINLDVVYASPQGIYGLVEIETEEELANQWEACSYELATRVQAKLPESLDNLRWDIYLIFLVRGNTSPLLRKLIENDRRFFKKIVVTKDEVNLNRLPFMFNFITHDAAKGSFIHQEYMFLNSLKSVLSQKAIDLLGEIFFENGEKLNSEDIYQLLKQTGDVVK
jgi:hypothetical protein